MSGFSPDLAAFKHAGVYDVRADQSGLDAVDFLCKQLVCQWLVETNGSKFTGAVILKE